MAADPGSASEAVEHIEVGLCPSLGPSEFAYVIAKLCFDVEAGALRPGEPEPLVGDFRNKDLEPRLQQGTDFWVFKPLTDVIVRGSAHSPGPPVSQMEISVQIGPILKRVAVFGDRPVEWESDGRPRIGPAQPFTEMPMLDENLYGGIDWRAPLDENDPNIRNYALEIDHPGLYPRNQFGKGYLCDPARIDDLLLPNFEDPDDLLAAGRLIAPDPRLWWRQPLPWTLDWMCGAAFPRCVLFLPGCDAWYEGPEDETMPEIARGFLAPSYRTLMASQGKPFPRFYQEASHGLTLQGIQGGTPVRICGMHPIEQDLRFALPDPPSIEFQVEERRGMLAPRLTSLICHPGEKKVTMTWSAVATDLGRIFIPGIHKHIPLSARINGGAPVHYQPPPTQKERIAEGMAKQAAAQKAAAEGASAAGSDPPEGPR